MRIRESLVYDQKPLARKMSRNAMMTVLKKAVLRKVPIVFIPVSPFIPRRDYDAHP
jgi:hypothetical protein